MLRSGCPQCWLRLQLYPVSLAVRTTDDTDLLPRAPTYKNIRVNETLCRQYVNDMASLGERVLFRDANAFTASTDMGEPTRRFPTMLTDILQGTSPMRCLVSMVVSLFRLKTISPHIIQSSQRLRVVMRRIRQLFSAEKDWPC